MSVGAHCVDCRRAAAPSTSERVRTAVALGTPYVTYGLIAVNVFMYVIALPESNLWFDLGTAATAIDLGGETYRSVTGAFLHGSIMHLAFNMLVLFQLGQVLERVLGLWRFAGLYALSLLGGSIGALLYAAPNTLTVGASGAVYGLMGAVAMLSRRRGIGVMQSGIGGLIIINIVISVVVPNISIGGHLGGLLTGGVAVLLLDPGSHRPGANRAADLTVGGVVIAAAGLLYLGTLVAANFAVSGG